MTLHVADGLDLADDFATKATAILAQRRRGKSYCAAVIAEECVEAGIPFAILDPTGAHWGLRASADGEGPGLPVVILGGQHGDLPLDRTSGAFVADLVLDHPGHYVLDLSFDSKAAEREFVTDFAERLYRRKGEPGMTFVFLLIVDEADMFVPQRHGGDEARMVGAFEAIVRRGGIRGLGVVLVSQRAAIVNKNVLEQIDILFALRTVGPNDRKALDDYVRANATDEERQQFLDSLASLKVGQAWFYEPGENLMLLVQVRARRTFNSSATPKAGETRVEPRLLAEVDLDRLRAAMAEAAALPDPGEDPDVLRKEVARLRAELDARPAPAPPERVEVPVFPEEWFAALLDFADSLDAVRSRYDTLMDLVGAVPTPPAAALAEPAPAVPTAAPAAEPATTPARRIHIDYDGVTATEQGLLDTVAWFDACHLTPIGRRQAALFAGLSATGGATNRAFASLVRRGLLDYPSPGRIGLTPAGSAAASPAALPAYKTFPELHEALYAKLDHDARARILRLAIDAHPESLDRAVAAVAAGLAPSGGATNRAFATLHALELIHYPAPGQVAAADFLFGY